MWQHNHQRTSCNMFDCNKRSSSLYSVQGIWWDRVCSLAMAYWLPRAIAYLTFVSSNANFNFLYWNARIRPIWNIDLGASKWLFNSLHQHILIVCSEAVALWLDDVSNNKSKWADVLGIDLRLVTTSKNNLSEIHISRWTPHVSLSVSSWLFWLHDIYPLNQQPCSQGPIWDLRRRALKTLGTRQRLTDNNN